MMLVEAAFILPLLLGITFLVLQYGWLFLKAEQVANAARHGARRAIVADAVEAEVITSITNYLTAVGITSYSQPTISDMNVAKGALITVTVSVQARNNPQIDLLGFSKLGGFELPLLPTQLRSSVSMAKERS